MGKGGFEHRPCATAGGPSPRLFFGLAIMGIGLVLTLDNLGLLESSQVWRFWPVLLIIAGGLRAWEAIREGRSPEGLGLAAIGGFLLVANLGLLHLRQVWPLFLLVAGAAMVWRAWSGGRGEASEGSPADQPTTLHAFAFMGGTKRASSAQEFERAEASALMGGVEIDLRQASMKDGEAVFDAFAVMGGVLVRVPEDWSVESRGVALLGGFEDKTRRPPDARKRLVVRGAALMGGVEVKN
jgi:Domain of unknown function (DUF5668)/Cell wall-active antibiotics response 4TMS YvqF